jgi:DNA-binding transcriptional LysR family regulator
MDTHKLKSFVAVAEELHFGRAAARLHVSQPPLSVLIRSLEEDLGVQLFRRTSRRVELTGSGQVLLEEARGILERLALARTHTEEAGRGDRGSLTVGFITPVIYSLLPDWLREFRTRYPGVRLTLRESMSDVQLEELVRGTLSAGFVAAPVTIKGLAQRIVMREPLVAVLPAAHALARGSGRLSLSRLREEPFVLFPRASAPGLFDHIVGFCGAVGFSPRIEQEAVQSQTIVGLVSSGLGVGIVPASISRLRRPGVVYRPFRERSPQVETALVWKDDAGSPALRNFVEIGQRFRG